MTDVPDDEQFRMRLLFHRPMRDLPDVADTLSAVDTVWVGSYDLALVVASKGFRLQSDGETLFGTEASIGPFRDFDRQRPGLPPEGAGARFDVPRPTPTFISMQSPLLVELVGDIAWPLGISASVTTLFRWLLKNPGSVGGFFPQFAEGWYTRRAAATRARTDFFVAQDEAADYLRERDAARQAREIAARVANAGHRLNDAGLEVLDEPSGDLEQ